MNLSEIFTWCQDNPAIVWFLAPLLGLALFSFASRVYYNGPWETLKGVIYTFTTRGGKGTTFTSPHRILRPGALSSRQRKMGEPTFVVPAIILLLIFLAVAGYALYQEYIVT